MAFFFHDTSLALTDPTLLLLFSITAEQNLAVGGVITARRLHLIVGLCVAVYLVLRDDNTHAHVAGFLKTAG